MKFYTIYFQITVSIIFILTAFSSCGDTQSCVDINAVDTTMICTNEFNPVCGCDNITYQNQCLAQRSGVVAWIGGPCP